MMRSSNNVLKSEPAGWNILLFLGIEAAYT
jgi:hypothetical protein